MEQIQIIDKKKYIIIALNTGNKIFVMYVAIKKIEQILIHFKKYIKIGIKTQVKALLSDKVFINIPVEYLNYSNIFLVANIIVLPKYTKINSYTIKPEKSK